MTDGKVRTRFAPSPTGYLHLGGARTALFAWAWAAKHNGEFLLRIEDTDAERSDEAHSRAIINAMDWLGLHADGEVLFQSSRRERHIAVAKELQEKGAAYEDEGALRLKIPDSGEVYFDDLVCGRLSVANKELKNTGYDKESENEQGGEESKDPVILRANQMPTYIFASAIDDIDSQITHVIRGDDHIRNTHKQLHIYAALNQTPPQFAHMPMIYGADGKRLSKRHAAVDVMEYQKEGFLPEALVNYLARLSWSHGDAEVFDAAFLKQHFDFGSISRSPARFDREKLLWLNGVYIRELSRDDLRKLANQPGLSDAAVDLIQPRAETLADVTTQAAYFTVRPPIPETLSEKHLTAAAKDAMQDLKGRLGSLNDWTAANIKGAMKETMKELGLKFPQVGMPMRVLLTAREQSPDIAEVAEVLGKDETLGRLGS